MSTSCPCPCLCVCTYMYVYACVCMCMYVHAYVCMSTYVYACVCMSNYVFCVCMYVCTYVYMIAHLPILPIHLSVLMHCRYPIQALKPFQLVAARCRRLCFLPSCLWPFQLLSRGCPCSSACPSPCQPPPDYYPCPSPLPFLFPLPFDFPASLVQETGFCDWALRHEDYEFTAARVDYMLLHLSIAPFALPGLSSASFLYT